MLETAISLCSKTFGQYVHSDWEVFYGAAATYADVLGEKGLSVYRDLAEKEWKRIPFLGPGRKDSEPDMRRFRITSTMETLAHLSEDIEALVLIKSRNLSYAYSYLQIAEIYQQAKKYDLAIEWAEKGIKAFPVRTDTRLREFLAQAYHHRKRHNEAMELIWADFMDYPNFDYYKNLKLHADRTNQWQEWREKALAYLCQEFSNKKQNLSPNQSPWPTKSDHSELV